jgi:hypothetical protein
MNQKIAEGIARCVSIIAQSSAKIAVIDQEFLKNGITQCLAQSRASLVKDIEKHEEALAAWLQR